MTSAGELLHRLPGEVVAADQRIRPWVRETPLDYAPSLSKAWGLEVYLKLENTQVTGSFKVRGAMNRLLTTPLSQRSLGVVAASTGNHGAAVAYAMDTLRVPGTVFVPESASPAKLNAIRAWGAEVRTVGGDPVEAEYEARRYADSHGLVYVSPYNDQAVVAGQGTVGAELGRQLARIDAVVVAVGGGGLISGVGGFLKAAGREVSVVGCSPSNSRVMYESVKAGHQVDIPSDETLSDGTAGGVESDSVTFPLCRTLVDEWVLVSEAEIVEGMRIAVNETHQLVEGAGAMTLAAAKKVARSYPGGNMAVVLCGANISADKLASVLTSR
jgi:threonine dehydratase